MDTFITILPWAILLIIFIRWATKPRTTEEIEKIKLEKEAREKQRKDHIDSLRKQEEEIKSLKSPVTFVSRSVDSDSHLAIGIQDADNKFYAFAVPKNDLEKYPFFKMLLFASYNIKIGDVILKDNSSS